MIQNIKYSTLYFIQKNYRFLLISFLFLSFYTKLDIFDKKFYNFYNDNLFYCCLKFDLKNNFSENLFNLLIFKNESFIIIHHLFLFANFFIPIFILKKFETVYALKFNPIKSIFFICIFIFSPILSITDIKYQISLFAFFLLILEFFKSKNNFFLFFLLIILMSLYPRFILSLFFFLINYLIIFKYLKKKIKWNLFFLLCLFIILINYNYLIDIFNLFIFNEFQNHHHSSSIDFFYKKTSPYYNSFLNNGIFYFIIQLFLSFVSFKFFEFDIILSFDTFFYLIFLVILNKFFFKFKFFFLIFFSNILIFICLLTILYNYNFIKLSILINPYTFIFALFPIWVIFFIFFLKRIKKNFFFFFIATLFILNNYFTSYFDSKYLTLDCINSMECNKHNYKKGGFIIEDKYFKLDNFLQKENINKVFLNQKIYSNKIYINDNLEFYFPNLFISENIKLLSILNLNKNFLIYNERVIVLSIINNNNSIYDYSYIRENNCVFFHVIHDFIICGLKID